MGSPKPCLGYPSRTAAIHALRVQGLATHEIADAIGIKEKNVIALECSSGRARQEPRERVQLGRTMVVPVDVLNALSPHAAKRGMTVNSLARLIVTIIVDENMVDAVLDDADALSWSDQ